ncbi:MAG: calcium-transporting ATPase [Spirosoma sp.]|nr:calcium-transporting ATPase [Spirosoma sp.]
MLAIHILWMNLITDGLPGLSLAYEPSETNSMKRPPTDPRQSIFADGLGWFILWVGLLIGAVTIGMEAWAIQQGFPHWQTLTFTVLCLAQLGNAIAIRSRRSSVLSMGLLTNKPMLAAITLTVLLQGMIIYTPFFNDLFNTHPLTWSELGITVAVSSLVFWAVELQKLFIRQRDNSRKPALTKSIIDPFPAIPTVVG